MPLSLGSKSVLTLDIAKAVSSVAEAHIAANGLAMFVAVVDESGTPLYVVRANDAQPASYDVAVQKAQVAARFRRPTKGFEDRILSDDIRLIASKIEDGSLVAAVEEAVGPLE